MAKEEETTSAALFVCCPDVFSLLYASSPLRWSPGLAIPKHTFYFIEGFRNKGLDGFKAFNYKSQCWELAATIADQLIR